ERVVELDLVRRKALEIAQRGIAGSKIIDRHLYAQLAQLGQDPQRALDIFHKGTFGEFDPDEVSREVPGGERTLESLRQCEIMEPACGNIDSNALGQSHLLPLISLTNCGFNDPLGHRRDETRLLGHGNELHRWNQPLLWVPPSHECLGTDHLVVRKAYLRLVE